MAGLVQIVPVQATVIILGFLPSSAQLIITAGKG